MYGYNHEQHIGKTITSIRGNRDCLVFTFNDHTIYPLQTYGDCCSYTEIDSFLGADKLIGSKFVSSDQDYTSAQEESNDYEYVQHYEFKVVADHPQFGEVTALAAYRNTSNGYYGGHLEAISTENFFSRYGDKKLTEFTDDVHRIGMDDIR